MGKPFTVNINRYDPYKTYRFLVYFGGNTPYDTPVYWRPDLPAGAELEGPAIIDQLDSTTVLPPGATMTVDRWSNIIMRVGGEIR